MTKTIKKTTKKTISSFLAGALLLPAFFITSGPLLEPNPAFEAIDQIKAKLAEFAPQEILVKFKSDSPRVIESLAKKHGATSLERHLLGVNSLYFPTSLQNIFKKLDELKSDPNVEFAELNHLAQAFFTPNDPYLSYQWSFGANSLDLGKVWDLATGQGVTVAVIDTGVAYENYKNFKLAPDLAQTKFTAGYNFVNNTTHANDDNSHGTHVSGTVAQSTNNGIGVAGLAFNATIMPIKVLDKSGSGKYSWIANGIIWAADKGAKIINLSLGGSSPSQTLEQALAYAKGKGVFIVAASGNNGSSSTISYPAAYDQYVMAVGATRYDKTVTAYSNQGASLDVVAPGGDLSVDQDQNGYGDGILQQTFAKNKPASFGYYFFQGTSMATPHTAATAALLVEKGLTDPTQIQQTLQNSADDLYTPGFDTTSGYGLINPYKALTSLVAPAVTTSVTSEPVTTEEPVASPPTAAKSLHISALSVEAQGSRLRVRAEGLVQIADQDNNPLANVQVQGTWQGLYNAEVTGKANRQGEIEFSTPYIWRSPGEFRFTITSVSLEGYEYNPQDNKTISDSVEIASRKNF